MRPPPYFTHRRQPMTIRQPDPKRPFWNKYRTDTAFAYALLLPAFTALALVIFFPILRGIAMSFFKYTFATMRTGPVWNDFANYKALFRSGDFFEYLKNTLAYMICSVSLQFLIAMSVALLLNTAVRGRNVLRGLFLVSWTVPSVVAAILWCWIFQPQYGIMNYLLSSLGLLGDPNMQWLQNPRYALLTVVAASLWKSGPYMIVMLLAGLQSVREDLIEAAAIDGASRLQIFFHIMIPGIRSVLDTTLIISVLSAFQQFTITYNMTGGGPITATTTLSIAAYKAAFTKMDLGLGSAIGVLWLILLSAITLFYNIKSRRFEDVE